MKTLSKLSFIATALLLFSNCSIGPKPIDYGNDGCHFCKMTIVDKIHASELITNKGKVFKFDATECMTNFLTENKEISISNLLTNYYESPTDFMPAQEATFLISENLPSPMGANLTAFKTREQADFIKLEKGGVLYNWQELRKQLNR